MKGPKNIKVGKGVGKEYSEEEVLQKCIDMISKYGETGQMGKTFGQAMFFARYCKKAIEQRRALETVNKNLTETISLLNDLR